MPGTIHVTVLEFKGVSTTSKLSAESLKVAMGKREFQTWDKGDFSFPIMKLREDLVVALLDAAGDEIARLDIRTIHIIEKGSWDEVFPINGCGHVHMKLQFILSEEDRNRIRIMRESVVKKKLEANPNINLKVTGESVEITKGIEHVLSDSQKGTEEISVLTTIVEASQASSSSDSATSSSAAVSSTSYRKEEETAVPDITDQDQCELPSPSGIKSESDEAESQTQTPSIKSVVEEVDSAKFSGSAIADDPFQESGKERREAKVPSNVRKMISAFENSQLQEVKSEKKTPVRSTLREGDVLDEPQQKASERSAAIVSSSNEELASSATTLKKPKQYGEDPSSQSTSSERSQVTQAYDIPTKLLNVTESSSAAEGSREARRTGLKSAIHYQEACSTTQSTGMWIFPDNTRRLCITTAGERDIESVAQMHQGKEVFLDSEKVEKNLTHGTRNKINKNRKESADLPESGSSSPPNGSSDGLVGKVIKVVAIMGFVLLVLLTRQKEPRKKKNEEEKDDLLAYPDRIN